MPDLNYLTQIQSPVNDPGEGGLRVPRIVDGFSRNVSLRYLPYRSFPMMLEALSKLRMSPDYRAKWLTIPLDSTVAIPSLTTFRYQARARVGSCWYGLTFNDLSAAPNLANWSVQITDNCTGFPLFSSEATAVGLRGSGATGLYPVLLSSPHLLEDGYLNIEIVNKGSTDEPAQLILLLAEPYERTY